MDTQIATCYHCGEDCTDEHVHFDDRDFCCHGCKSVYQILNDHDLTNFYTHNEQAGLTQKNRDAETPFDFLQNAEITDSLLKFKSEFVNHITVHVPEIYCSSCVWLLEHMNRLDSGIIATEVNLTAKDLFIRFNPTQTSLYEIAQLLTRLGYRPEFHRERKTHSMSLNLKRMYIKLAVAGFAFGNVMLLSFPEYLHVDFQESEFRSVFPWLNLLISLPVLIYAAADYFRSAAAHLKRGVINIDVPISIGIAALFIRSLADILFFDQFGYFDSFCGFVFFLLIGKTFQTKIYDHLSFEKEYKSYLPLSALKKIDDEFKPVPLKDLMTGDVIRVRHSEIVPADAHMISKSALIDYSFVTGESTPQHIMTGQLVYAGGRIVNESVMMRVRQPVDHSYLVQLWSRTDAEQKELSTQQLFIDKISAAFTVIVLVIANLTFLLSLEYGVLEALNRLSAVLIVACPCALALSTPFTLGTVSTILARVGFYFKDIHSLDQLTRIRSIIFDKTGTLTESGSGNVTNHLKTNIYDAEISWLMHQSVHPLSQKIAAVLPSSDHVFTSDFEEIKNRGLQACINGKQVIAGSARFLKEHNLTIDANDTDAERSRVWIAVDSDVLGFFEVKQRYRDGLDALTDLSAAGYDMHMLSGDNNAEQSFLSRWFQPTRMAFRQSPSDKKQFVDELEQSGIASVMFGDGLNDAAALQRSRVGVSVVESESQFTPACDAILAGKSLHKLPQMLGLIRSARSVLIASFAVSFLYNIIGLGFAAAGELTPLVSAILMPVSSITIILIAVISTRVLAARRGLA